MLIVMMLSIILQDVLFLSYAECRYADFNFVVSTYSECIFTECCNAERSL